MAQRILSAGHDLTVYARRPEQADALVAGGARRAGSVGALAEASELLGVCVGTDAQVLEVTEAAVAAMSPESVVAVHSTVDPRTCVELGDLAEQHGVEVLDAPVSGGRDRALRGELTVMVGGAPEAVSRARPVFETFGDLVVHAGDLGAGQKLKLLNNFLFAAQLAVTEDAIALCRTLGLDVAQSLTAVAASTGSSRVAQMFVEGGFAQAFPRHSAGYAHGAQLLSKDIDLFDTLLPSGAIPPVLNLSARTGLDVALHTEERLGAAVDSPKLVP